MSNLPTIVALLVLLLFAALGLLAYALHQLLHGRRAKLKRRLAQIVGDGPAKGALPSRRRTLQSRLRQGEGGTRQWAWTLREQLMQAGIRIGVGRYLAVCGGLAALSWLICWALGLPLIAGPLAAAIIGFGIPKLAVGWLAKRRIAKFTTLFADGLDVIVRGIRSGLPLGECINIIGREMPEPLGSEFRLIAEGQKLGLTLQDSLERAVERTPTPDFRYFSIVLAIQQQTGGNLAETLAKLSDVLRQRKRMRDKIKAFSSEATASAMIIGSLPFCVAGILTLIGPDYILVLFRTDVGHLIIGAGLLLMVMGGMVMRKMINFDL